MIASNRLLFDMMRSVTVLLIISVFVLNIYILWWSRYKVKSGKATPLISKMAFWSKATFAVLICTILLAVVYIVCETATIPNSKLTIQSAANEGKALLIGVGGAEKVREEARRIFKRFGRSKIGFKVPELIDYPVIGSLGQVDGIIPAASDFPAYIKIRVRGHLNGYVIAVCDPDEPRKPIAPFLVEISTSIYVAK